ELRTGTTNWRYEQMYRYRRLTKKQQQAAVDERRQQSYPWHGPPHIHAPGGYRIVTGACYEHKHILKSNDRLHWFAQELIDFLQDLEISCAAWCVLPNHYHLLVNIADIKTFSTQVGQLHGRTSFELNGQDGKRGRKVWYRCQDRKMRSERHFFASLNYIHNNPVKHHYVTKWQDWPHSSVHWYLEQKGRGWLLDLWHEYPLFDYGEKWDEF
ncbi:MAG TPA: transposase, partial [Pirellulales bacterium]|nr:transposase [Pirellulales bacterium]